MSVPADVLSQALNPQVNQNPAPAVPATPVVRGQIAPRPAAVKPVAPPPETDIQRAERLSRETETYEQTPEVLARQKEIERQNTIREQAENQMMLARQRIAKFEEQAAERMEQYAKKIETQGVIPEYKDTFQKQAPVAMILMALMGRAARAPGLAMLQGSTGMMQGLQQADLNAYNKARQQYLDGVDQLKTVADTWNRVYDMRIKAAGNDVLAQQEAINMANTAIGNEQAAIQKGLNQKEQIAKNARELASLKQKEQEHNDSLQERLDRSREMSELRREALEEKRAGRLEKTRDKVDSALYRTEDNLKIFQNAKELWEQAKKDMGGSISATSVIDSDMVERFKSKSDSYGRAVQAFKDMAGSALALQNEGLTGAAQRIAKVETTELQSLPNPQGKTIAQVDQSINDLIRKTQFALNHYEAKKRTLDETSGGSQPEPTPASKPMPDAAKLKTYADQHFGGDVNKARDYLKSQGYE